jgi:hypothetical protein
MSYGRPVAVEETSIGSREAVSELAIRTATSPMVSEVIPYVSRKWLNARRMLARAPMFSAVFRPKLCGCHHKW